MTIYGIRNRSPFVQYRNALTGTKQGASTTSESQKRYYSSIDAEIYFGNYYVDDVVQIVFEVTQNNLPIFGYNSYVYDEVAYGSRLIQGQFTINFTRPGYMYKLLDTISSTTVLADSQNILSEDIETDPEDDMDRVTEAKKEIEEGEVIEVPRYRRPLFRESIDIDIMFGEETFYKQARHVMLEGVVLGSSSIGLDPSGQPITETYSFIAKDMVAID